MLGICNGFQVLCEAGLLPGALLPNTSLRFVCRQVELEVVNADTTWTARLRAGRPALDPGQAQDRPLLGARPGARRARGGRPGRRSATPPATSFNGSARDIAGVCNEAGNVVGLMPHPEHAVDPLTGSADGLKLFESAAPRSPRMTVAARHRELGLTDSEYDLIVELLGREPNEVELAIFSLMWSRALRLQALAQAAADAADRGPARRHGPGRERGRGRRRRRAGVRVQGRVAQPPERGRAVPGRRDRRRRHPARHLRDRRAADRGARLAALRRAGGRRRARATCSSARSPASATTATRSASPTVGGEIYFEAAYEQNCLVNAMCLGLIETEKLIRSAAAGVGNVVVLFGARTGRDGIGGASVLASRRARRRRRREAPDGADRRPVRGEEAARVLARAARRRAARRAAGPRRRRA